MPDIPHALLWSIWPLLPLLLRVFFLVLCLVTAYTLVSAAAVIVRLRSLKKRRQAEDVSSLQRPLAALEARCANMRELVGATFYFFGFLFFLALPMATLIIDNSKTPGGELVLRNFVIYFAFAANAFFIFLVLHCLQWFVSVRIQAFARRSMAQDSK